MLIEEKGGRPENGSFLRNKPPPSGSPENLNVKDANQVIFLCGLS